MCDVDLFDKQSLLKSPSFFFFFSPNRTFLLLDLSDVASCLGSFLAGVLMNNAVIFFRTSHPEALGVCPSAPWT